jgi:hypothetical protein
MTFHVPEPSQFKTPEEFLEALRHVPEFEGKFNTAPILNRAFGKVHGPREKEYGDKYLNFGDIAEFWTTFLRMKLREGAEITRTDVALMQDLTKTARLMKSTGHEDGRDDKVGYVLCLDEILAEEWRREQERLGGNPHREGKGSDR